jgi:hypothetical protein
MFICERCHKQRRCNAKGYCKPCWLALERMAAGLKEDTPDTQQ